MWDMVSAVKPPLPSSYLTFHIAYHTSDEQLGGPLEILAIGREVSNFLFQALP
jgi:hypothetical protein